MAKYTATITADGSTQLAVIQRRKDAPRWMGTVSLSGTFGSGTYTLQWSPDGGTTKISIPDANGTTGYTAATVLNLDLGNGSHLTDSPILYVLCAGSTNPSVTVTLFDNR